MSSLALDNYITALPSGGARPNLFEIELNPPTGSGENLTFKIKAASLPAVTIGVITTNYMGREYKIPGDQTFADFSLTVIADEGLATRKAFEDWMNAINEKQENVTTSSTLSTHMVEMTLKTFKRDGSVDATYVFYNTWINNIGEITLDWSSRDTIMEFPVTLSYSSFKRAS
jgi:hypothetical protein